MELATKFSELARRSQDLWSFARDFSLLAATTTLDDKIGANHHHPVDLPDATGLNWRKVISRCLVSVRPRSGTQLDPEPSPPSPCQPKPTADGEPEPSATHEPSQEVATEPRIAPEPITSNQVKATAPLLRDFINMDLYADLPVLLPPSFELPVCPKLSTCLDLTATHPFLPPPIIPAASALPLLLPGSLSAHPQPTICAVGLPRVCQSPSALWLEGPWSPPTASDGSTSAPLCPSSPVGPPAMPGALIPLAPPWSADSTPPVALSHWLPWFSVTPAQTSGSPPRSTELSAPPWPSGSSASPWLVGSLSQPRAPPPLAPPPPSSTMAPPSVDSTMGRHHGCGLGSPAPSPSCFLPGSSLCLIHLIHPVSSLDPVRCPSLRGPSSSRTSTWVPFSSPFVLLLNPTLARGRVFREGGGEL
ncbi:hypothetical protein M9458_048122, partial [Cirrhinus mrigala]